MSLVISDDIKRLVDERVKAHLPEVVRFRHERHLHPELTWQEVETAKAVAAKLREIKGLSVREGVGRLGVVAVLEGAQPGPTVALRADMDALAIQEDTGKSYSSQRSGVMHACGHDGHMANLLGSALVLADLQQHLRGRVKFIFQPAEEGGAGADVMCDDGVLENPSVDVIFGLHGWPEMPCGQVFLRSGAMMASTSEIAIKVRGKGCHAAMPHLGTDQVLIAARIVEGLQAIRARYMAPTEPMALSITKFNGGEALNVIPATVEIAGTLRTLCEETKKRCCELICEIAEGIAKAHGAEAACQFRHAYPPTINHEKSTNYLEQIAKAFLPESEVQQLPVPTMGAEDFAYFLKRVPGSYFFLGMNDGRPGGYPTLHHPAYDFNDQALPVGMKMFTHAALHYAAQMGGKV